MPDQIATYHVGKAVITRIVETQFSLAFNVLFPGAVDGLGRAIEQRTLPADFTPSQPVTLSIHSWLVEMDGLKILIDTGIGNHKPRPFSALFHQLETDFLQQLAEAGATPDQIDYVLLTHLHTDHVGWNTRLVEGKWLPTFPKARYVMPKNELEFFFTPAGEPRRMLFDDSILPVICANQATFIAEKGGEILPGIMFNPAPGHSVGHMTISLRSDGQDAIFCGDAMHNDCQVAHPEWGSVFCIDPPLAMNSRLQLLETAATQAALVLPAHFPQTSAGYVDRTPAGFAWRYC